MKRRRFKASAVCSVSPEDFSLYERSKEQHYLFLLKETRGNEELAKAINTGYVKAKSTDAALRVTDASQIIEFGYVYFTQIYGKPIDIDDIAVVKRSFENGSPIWRKKL